ncbi:2-hydroxyacid dehydrogenase [Halalkalibacterium halodurans]|uniref:2-hydroxyacid dehydrogenase n=1 Tax=Halalkalibacterium halodurans TaxID=86665 RepID=UPI002AA97F5F|nr:D-glycerate dehydrogenase [Halalkalibacterium halodurans]MDY7223847.1 D-glycerate dehydrogenase [Halalkalibacterium halodurans]MDY7243068.1 D-glycerate dehydrogenase [Halalkalibacterium halodurans]
MRLLFTRALDPEWIEPLKDEHDIRMWTEENIPMPRELFLKELEEADGVFTNLTDRFDVEAFERAKRLKVVSTMAVGYDNIDIKEATKRGVSVGHTPGVLTEATADLTFALLMATGRRLRESIDYVRNDQWKSWGPFMLTGQAIYGTTLGIIGMGRIGQAVAKRAKGFNMTLLYHNRSRNEQAEKELGATYCSLDHLLARSDYVVLLAPSTDETRKMMGPAQFQKMKSTAHFINTSRGTNVDEQALYRALTEGWIAGAGLDVYEKEPISADHPLVQLPNVVALPHIGSAEVGTRREMVRLAIENLLLGIKGKSLTHIANPEVHEK